jgi:hypothetical protein
MIRLSKEALITLIRKIPFDGLLIPEHVATDVDSDVGPFLTAIGDALARVMIQNSPPKASPKKLLSTSYLAQHHPSTPTPRLTNPSTSTIAGKYSTPIDSDDSDDDIIGMTSSMSNVDILIATREDNSLHEIDNSSLRISFLDMTTETVAKTVDLFMSQRMKDFLRPVVDKIHHASSHPIDCDGSRTYIPDITTETVDLHMPQRIKDALHPVVNEIMQSLKQPLLTILAARNEAKSLPRVESMENSS